MFELCFGALEVPKLYAKWYEKYRKENLGAFVSFCGIVRNENGIEALSFDVYENLLKSWFEQWCKKAAKEKIKLCFAHSINDVSVYESSYLAGVFSKKRTQALLYINDFVEDFKKKAPIWKYELKKGQRIYSLKNASLLENAGILA